MRRVGPPSPDPRRASAAASICRRSGFPCAPGPAPAIAPGSRRVAERSRGPGLKPAAVPILRLNSTKVSRAVRSTARRDPSAGGFSSTISSSATKPVAVRKLRTAVVMLASGSARLCRRKISAAASAQIGSLGSICLDIAEHSRQHTSTMKSGFRLAELPVEYPRAERWDQSARLIKLSRRRLKLIVFSCPPKAGQRSLLST